MTSFDARAAKLMKPGERMYLSEHPGLRLETSKRCRSWIFRYRSPVTGLMKQIKIGEWPELSVSAAIVAWEELKKRRDAGEDPSVQRWEAKDEEKSEKVRRSRAATVGDVCYFYLKEHIATKRKPKGAANVRHLLESLVPTSFAELDAETVTRTQAFELIQDVAARAPVQAKYLRLELGAAWDHALDAGRLRDTTPNWWRMILRGKIKSKGKKIAGEYVGTAKRWLTDQEVGELLCWMPNFSELLRDGLTLYLWLGVRGDEIVKMEGADITEEPDGWWWTVPKEKTKNARHENATDLRVPLVGRALEIVQKRMMLHNRGFLFPAKGVKPARPIEQKTLQSTVYTHQPYSLTRPEFERPRLPVTHWAPHDLRRTVRTCLAKLRCPDDVGEAIVGHMQEGVKGIYNLHAYDVERREWLTRLADHWEAVYQIAIAARLPRSSEAAADPKPGGTLPTP